jgi:hypothetical protein
MIILLVGQTDQHIECIKTTDALEVFVMHVVFTWVRALRTLVLDIKSLPATNNIHAGLVGNILTIELSIM